MFQSYMRSSIVAPVLQLLFLGLLFYGCVLGSLNKLLYMLKMSTKLDSTKGTSLNKNINSNHIDFKAKKKQ